MEICKKPKQIFHDLRYTNKSEFVQGEAVRIELSGRLFDARFLSCVSGDACRVVIIPSKEAIEWDVAGQKIVIPTSRIRGKQSVFELLTIARLKNYHESLNPKFARRRQGVWIKSIPQHAMSQMRRNVVIHEFYTPSLHSVIKLVCFSQRLNGTICIIKLDANENPDHFKDFRKIIGYELEDATTEQLPQ
eukprot:UN24751